MERLPFRQLPLAVKVAVGVAFYDLWWMLEEFIIEPHGLWHYMPFYRVDNGCVWDLGVATIITLAIWRPSWRRDRGA